MSSSTDPAATCPGTLSFFGFADTRAQVAVVRHAHADRLKHAVLALAACWGIAALTVLIPIAHFVLVPAFFVLGIVLFAKKLGEHATFVGLTGTCPRCQATGPFEVSGRAKARAAAQCGSCMNQLGLSVEENCVKG
jgi:hypothetical protein